MRRPPPSLAGQVRELDLFKMDTIGDAYIVAGFLPPHAAAADAAAAAEACGRVLAVAAEMLRVVDEVGRRASTHR